MFIRKTFSFFFFKKQQENSYMHYMYYVNFSYYLFPEQIQCFSHNYIDQIFLLHHNDPCLKHTYKISI